MNWLRAHVFQNFWLKVISLAVAVGLWAAISREPKSEVTVTVPIEFLNGPGNLEISTESIPQVLVRLSGPSGAVHDIGPADVHALIDLTGANPGERTYDLNPRRIRVPNDVEAIQVIPSQIRISFDNRAMKQVDVKPRVIGTSAPGYRLQTVNVNPDSVLIVGPEQRVKAVESVITDPVDASGVMGNAIFTTHVYVSDPLVRLAGTSAVHVTVVTDRRSAATGH